MTILNFPASPSNGDVYVANGISYVYNDNAWTSNSAESNTELFVNVIGDNMTGNLTLGGDKISLSATTGVGLFAGDVKIGGTLPSAPNITLASDGSSTFRGSLSVAGAGTGNYCELSPSGSATFTGTVEAPRVNAGGLTRDVPAITALNGSATNGSLYARNNNGGAAPCIQAAGGDGSVKASIYNDGSATFTGDLTAASLIASGNGSGVIASRSVGGTSSVWRAGDGDFNPDDPTTYTSEIKADGSITAATAILNSPAPDVAVQEWYSSTGFRLGYMYQAGTAGGRLFLQASDGSQNITLDGVDGSASFASTVVVAPDNGRQIELADSPTGGVVYVRKNDGTRNILLSGEDGSASFAGGAFDISSAGVTTVTDTVRVNRTGETQACFIAQQNGVNNINLMAGGDATFAGDLTLSDYTPGSNGVRGANYNTAGGLTVQGIGASTDPLFTGLGGNSSDVKFSVKADGSASFAGDVTAFSSSDINLKKNIEPIDSALSKVLAISGVTYNWKDESKPGREAGVIAQEVQEVLPEVVTTREDGTLAIRYERLVPLLIEAIKELAERG